MSRVLALCVAAVGSLGCASQQLPPPPPYTPANSPEPATACVAEAKAAKDAREGTVGNGGASENVAKTVFFYAECESRHFDQTHFANGTSDQTMESVESAKARFQTVRNLYEEVARHKSARWTIAAWTRLGDLHGSFAAKLRDVQPPSDLNGPLDRAEFLGEMQEISHSLELQAATSYGTALDTADASQAEVAADRDAGAWVKTACAGLVRFDPYAARGRQACVGAASSSR